MKIILLPSSWSWTEWRDEYDQEVVLEVEITEWRMEDEGAAELYLDFEEGLNDRQRTGQGVSSLRLFIFI